MSKDIEEAEQADIRRKEKADEIVHPRTLAAWLDDATTEALEACDDAMMLPGAAPNNTREILEAGYRLYHSPGYKSAGLPEADEERAAYDWAVREQGYEGSYARWCANPEERAEYETGAAGIGTV